MGLFDFLRRKPQAGPMPDLPRPQSAPEPVAPPPLAPAICPYCSVIFKSVPKRKRICPACGKQVVVRRGRPVTEDQAKEIDEYWALEFWATIESGRVLSEGEPEPITSYAGVYDDRLPEKDGRLATMRDVPWSLLTQRATEARQRDDIAALSRWQLLQARRLFEEGKPHFKIRCESELASLVVMQHEPENGPSTRLEIAAYGCCGVCNVNDEKRMTIATALKTLPIPNERCQKGWCTCTWEF